MFRIRYEGMRIFCSIGWELLMVETFANNARDRRVLP